MKIVKLLLVFILPLSVIIANAQEAKILVLITNAKIFDGSDKLVEGKDVLIKGNKIEQIAKGIMTQV